jgi:hypothetical protein
LLLQYLRVWHQGEGVVEEASRLVLEEGEVGEGTRK